MRTGAEAMAGGAAPVALRYRRWWQGTGWLLVAAVAVLSLLPQPPQPPVLTWDKSHHLLAYGLLMFWFRQSFAPRPVWVAFLVALGLVLEVLQGLSGYRYFEWADLLANTLGVGAGLALAATPAGTLLARLDRRLSAALRTRPGTAPGATAPPAPPRPGPGSGRSRTAGRTAGSDRPGRGGRRFRSGPG